MGNDNKNFQKKGKNFKGKGANKSAGRYSDNRRNDRVSSSDSNTAGYDCGHNDPNWYASDQQLMKDAASLSFYTPTGIKFDTARFGFTEAEYAVPGICRIDYVPTFGVSKDATSAVNVAARNLYSFVRSANSGARNYNSPDLMLAVMGVEQAYIYWAWMVRIYGLLNLYKTKNRYYPKALIESMGLDYEDLIQRMPEFQYRINLYARRLTQLPIPGDMNYMKRALWCVSHVWKDSQDEKAQLYYFHPTRFWTYDETTSEEGGFLKVANNNISTLNDIITMAESIITPLVTSEDIALMTGDIRKAYGDASILSVAAIPDNFIIDTEYSAEVCSQIQNATCWGTVDDTNIIQDPATNAILYNPNFSGDSSVNKYPTRLVLNMRGGTEPSDIMVATRLMSMPKYVDNKLTLQSVGTEIVTGFKFYSSTNYSTINTSVIGVAYDDPDYALGIIQDLTAITQFDYHPNLYMSEGSTTGSNPDFVGIFGDLDNYTWITSSDLERMNECAVLSLILSKTAFHD